ncbi:MAG: hypothetical protein Q4B16_00525 [Bacteroidia bacterium]|nr:hypothetical protein [Bacteroidia bacterium]
MNRQEAEDIKETLRAYSSQAECVLSFLEKYDYREEANAWNEYQDPKLLEPEHPTLRGLYHTLARFIGPIPGRTDNLSENKTLSRENIEDFLNYLEVSRDIPLALKFNGIKIEPLKEVAEKFEDFNLKTEARRLNNIYNFALGVRRWARESKNNSGAPILINIELNYDEATPEDLSKDSGFKMFSDLFKKTSNYSTAQKRKLYQSIKDLYATQSPKIADKTLMALILIFRTSRKYQRPFEGTTLTECKRKAFESFGRTLKDAGNYSEGSLSTSKPTLGQEHKKRAENLIAEAFS